MHSVLCIGRYEVFRSQEYGKIGKVWVFYKFMGDVVVCWGQQVVGGACHSSRMGKGFKSVENFVLLYQWTEQLIAQERGITLTNMKLYNANIVS